MIRDYLTRIEIFINFCSWDHFLGKFQNSHPIQMQVAKIATLNDFVENKR